jgi:hypothetical protein
VLSTCDGAVHTCRIAVICLPIQANSPDIG